MGTPRRNLSAKLLILIYLLSSVQLVLLGIHINLIIHLHINVLQN